MKRLFAACALALSMIATPVSAQQQDVQVLLAEAAIWSRDFGAVMTQAAEPLAGIDAFVQIMDRFGAGEIDAQQRMSRPGARTRWRRSPALAPLPRRCARRRRSPISARTACGSMRRFVQTAIPPCRSCTSSSAW
jgi:hypothetical protein